MKNITLKNLIAVMALAFMLFGAQSASAYVVGVWEPQPRIVNNEPAFTKVNTTEDKPFTPEMPVKQTVATSTTTTTQTPSSNSTSTKTVTNNSTTNKNTTTNKSTNTSKDTQSNLPPVVIDNGASGFTNGASTNGLTALSLQGSGSFMPSSIWQWFLVVLLILIIIIIARTFKKPEGYHAVAH